MSQLTQSKSRWFAIASLVFSSWGLAGCTAATDELERDSASEDVEDTSQALDIAGVTFQTVQGGRYLGAQNNGGSTVNATATVAQGWEKFTLDDINGGSLVSGDQVFVRAGNGQYFQAVNGGGSSLNAASNNRLGWETFRIVKESGSGTIANGDVVGLQTVTTGNWVSAQNGGGGAVFAYGGALGSWERLRIGGLSTCNQNPGTGFGAIWSRAQF